VVLRFADTRLRGPDEMALMAILLDWPPIYRKCPICGTSI
jgi:hypothetical protein